MIWKLPITRLTSAAPLLALTTACAGDVGVHAVVTMDEAQWQPLRPIDHIRLEARSSDLVAVACLYPATELVVALEPSSSAAFGCADEQPDTINGTLDFDEWNLAEGRSVNFVFPDDQSVTLSASAGFGGALELMRATATATPDADYPTVSLPLANVTDDDLIGTGSCPIRLDEVSDKAVHACSNTVGCAVPLMQMGNTSPHTAAMVDVGGDFCRVSNGAAKHTCASSFQGKVVGSLGNFELEGPNPPGDYSHRIKGRFARCVDGEDPAGPCTLTTDCHVPRTAVVAAKKQGVVFGLPGAGFDAELSCLPPTTVPVEFVVRVAVDTPEKNAVYALTLAQELADDLDNPCFFDVFSVEAVGSSQ